ncbi:MAG TPA: endonuclease/exonuclease/phosphatase family protein [Casimicrobiaceae bacterium]|nr:endonuclease/exonuclease/phosphatase family protein [Casimicrobiaceae bacterium]
MILVTWNTQWCRGVDGNVDPARIVSEAKRLADFDVLCLQEIADNYPDPLLPKHPGDDQFARLAELLPDYAAIAAPAVDVPGQGKARRRFGNMILSRLPVRQVFRHLLPFPVDAGVKAMPRIAVEATVAAAFGDVRVITTHLEYYSKKQRTAQVEALRAIYAEGWHHAREGTITERAGNPFHTYLRPDATLVCGDFNFEPQDPLHARMLDTFDDGSPPLRDAWDIAHAGVAHPPTTKIYLKDRPDEAEEHCDFVFVNAALVPRVRSVVVDVQTQAADHQPIIVTLA